MPVALQLFALLASLLAAATALALAGWQLSRRRGAAAELNAMAGALLLSAGWALADAGLGPSYPATQVLLGLNGLAWLWLIHRLFGKDDRHEAKGPLRPVILASALAQMLQLSLVVSLAYTDLAPSLTGPAVLHLSLTLRLLCCIGALVLVHNLYAGASAEGREALRWPAAAMTLIWLYDLNLATVSYLVGGIPQGLAMFRGLALLICVLLLALGASRVGLARRFSPSRSVTFQSFSLMGIGAYLLAMLLVSEGLSLAGTQAARVAQFGFLAVAGALAVMILPSASLRGRLRVLLSKHLFQHRYDYRAEWLRFNDTMGRAGDQSAPLRQRIAKALADVTGSPAGALLARGEDGGLAADARWCWRGLDMPAAALDRAGARFFEDSQFIVDLDDVRGGRADNVPPEACPPWVLDQDEIWAMVPLIHFDRLLGVVLLARPPVPRRLDWEDFDLLRVIGRQLASYLAEQASQDALGEAQRFDEFNRRIAFVMHDIKNLTSQLTLLARNAERHADNPDFRADMLVTLRNSADKLEALLARLGRYGAPGGETVEAVALADLLARVVQRCSAGHSVILMDRPGCEVRAVAEALEQALVHLVHNAIDASNDSAPVFVDYRHTGSTVVVEIVDSGSGMDAEFVRTGLFRPFHSTKPNGFGIGAYEARELIRAMGGRLDVESREGLGTRFLIHLPFAAAAPQVSQLHNEVA
jgi:putative PEP-CTERM system histidine kinase